MDRADAHLVEEPAELILDDVGKRADDQERALVTGLRQFRNHGGEAGILALGEGGLDAAARVVQDPDVGRELPAQALGGTVQIELDHLGRAGAHEKQQLDVGPPLEQPCDHPIQLLVGIRHAGEVALLEDRRGEARLGEDHDAGGRLDQVRAGARADDQEERVLDLAVQPDDAGEAAKDFALAPLEADRCIRAAADGRGRAGHSRHRAGSRSPVRSSWSPLGSELSLAIRSFHKNCAALTT